MTGLFRLFARLIVEAQTENKESALRLTALFTLMPALVAAQEFTPLTGAEIETALNDVVLTYPGGEVQSFYASGRTLYNAGRPSWGYWTVRGDQYCSQWPPAADWACYDMDAAGDVLRFIGASGHVSPGTVTRKLGE